MFSFLRHNFRWIFGGFLLTYFSSFGQTFFISASAGEWRETFSLSHGEFGQLYMLATLASAASLPFVGKIVDVIPEHRTVILVVPVLAVATVIAAYAPNVLILGIAIYFLRLFGQGMMTHTALTATGRWFAANRGRAVSLVVLGHQGGEATLPILFALITVAFGYQIGWVAGAAALICIALPIGVWAFREPRTPESEQTNPTASGPNRTPAVDWTRPQVLGDQVFWLLLTGILAPPFIGTTLFFHQDYLTDFHSWPPQLFATGFMVMAATTTIFALINGYLIDRFGAVNVLPFFLLPLGLACLAVSASGTAASLFGFMFLLGISYGMSSTLFGALWPEIYGVTHLGAIRSVIVAASVFATAAGPGITGTLIDRGTPLTSQSLYMAVYCLAISLAMAACAVTLRNRAGSTPS